MTTFKGLRHQWSANQEARYFVNVVFVLTALTYIFLQIRLLHEIRSLCEEYGITGYGISRPGILGLRDTKLVRFLHKNQHTQRMLLNFENWTSGEPQ